jgi:hypothetical protein
LGNIGSYVNITSERQGHQANKQQIAVERNAAVEYVFAIRF